MTIHAARRAVIVVASLTLVAVVVPLAACSGGDDGDAEETTTAPTNAGPPAAWLALRADPCSLLDSAEVADVLGWSGATAELDSDRESTCRFRSDDSDDRALTVEVLRPQTKQSLADRTAGTTTTDGGARLRLDTPGMGAVVANGGAAAVVAIRDGELSGDELVTAIGTLSASAQGALPEMRLGQAYDGPPDPCVVVPVSDLEGETVTGADAQDPALCAYNLADGTLLRFGTAAAPEAGLDAAGEELEGSTPGARWSGTQEGTSSSVRILAPSTGDSDDEVIDVYLTSPARSLDSIKEMAATIAAAMAEGG